LSKSADMFFSSESESDEKVATLQRGVNFSFGTRVKEGIDRDASRVNEASPMIQQRRVRLGFSNGFSNGFSYGNYHSFSNSSDCVQRGFSDDKKEKVANSSNLFRCGFTDDEEYTVANSPDCVLRGFYDGDVLSKPRRVLCGLSDEEDTDEKHDSSFLAIPSRLFGLFDVLFLRLYLNFYEQLFVYVEGVLCLDVVLAQELMDTYFEEELERINGITNDKEQDTEMLKHSVMVDNFKKALGFLKQKNKLEKDQQEISELGDTASKEELKTYNDALEQFFEDVDNFAKSVS